ncbi:C4-dicarboxylate transporter/malic acid transport protein [Candidatus Arthromitus sp. SFB-mouse-SU]|uniref:TDT family transporter n=1 Tax=Candidatus Arthromitus sp. SFB-mouse TaxID=49118 RepID=UPI00022AE81C|nr:TDT family transporter [Candidatus Arthromitus sp. SFB-mouse]EIA23675.1 C4-dicarboxylate transporter/malic acid transport protein [Candidatus Arthromitus sp. SFB-1]EIA23887.1 hypothetical protein SFB2_128G17 [Candidatus Arthromitus sp. SFB-2]EIA27466.1 C4-dicarboxylate transporter/malic acid transport protein [Candidatus Arthromitus sp. SFB-co]EIA30821.1 C4-dicarboxylate transporter/malic acid transport protein [Candidatus Arthromitus sp. SFB-mouse-SU]EGX28772.1 C4-dicarboxylate transporter
MKDFLSKIPVPIVAVSLGLASLGNLLKPSSKFLYAFCGILALIFLLLMISKIIFCTPTFIEEFRMPVISSVFASFFMAVMVLTNYIADRFITFAFIIWVFSVIGHIILIIYFTIRRVYNFSLKDIFPTYFVTYVGIIVAAITSVPFKMQPVGKVIFVFGLAAYVVLFILITLRYIKHEVHVSLKPLFCIYTAPMSLAIAGYSAVFEQKSLKFLFIAGCIAQLLYLIVLTQLPKLLRSQFYPSFAAFTFPFVITATALKQVVANISTVATIPIWMTALVNIEIFIAIILVSYSVIHYLIYLYKILPMNRLKSQS